MPLIHSKKPKAFKHNVEAEVRAGKPVKQAVAIAYKEKRDAEREHYYDGGQTKKQEPNVFDRFSDWANSVGASTGQQAGQMHHIEQVPPENKIDSASAPLQNSSEPPKQPPHDYAKGGAVGEPSLHDMAADELMEALESKDKHRIMECMKACMATMGHDESED